MIQEQKKEFRRKMKQKRMELKEMLLRRKIDPIYDPKPLRSSHDVRAAPQLAQKQFRSRERIGVVEGPAPSGGHSSRGSQGVTYGIGLSSGRFKNKQQNVLSQSGLRSNYMNQSKM